MHVGTEFFSVVQPYIRQNYLNFINVTVSDNMVFELQGANILVDNKGCIKLADFGASKQVVELVLNHTRLLCMPKFLSLY